MVSGGMNCIWILDSRVKDTIILRYASAKERRTTSNLRRSISILVSCEFKDYFSVKELNTGTLTNHRD